TNVLRALILDYAVRRAFEPSDETRDLFCANLAMQCFSHKHLREDAFTAALLRDIGGRITRARGSSSPLSAARLSAHLLASWGLPYTIVEAVAHQDEPSAIPHEGLDLVDAVHAAALLVEHQLDGRSEALELARAHFERIGTADRIARLRTIAEHWLAQPELS
ncbi:MAG TPA: hypothetical protein VHZ95_04490, partial [Polyangiales bacterium]|nr:hypothetical protein [Polyangiales bacterium]